MPSIGSAGISASSGPEVGWGMDKGLEPRTKPLGGWLPRKERTPLGGETTSESNIPSSTEQT